MQPRVIAIGDIHGCSRALQALLGAIEPRGEDTLVVLGDFVDRGPDTRGVVELLLDCAQRRHLIPLLGNHEELLLAALRDPATSWKSWVQYGGAATLASYGGDEQASSIPEPHREFLRGCRPYYETATHFFVHANYVPELALAEQPGKVLRWLSLAESVPAPHISGKRAIIGHTADKSGEIFDLGHLTCIDTYCYGGKWLTALDVASGALWQANEQGRLRGRG